MGMGIKHLLKIRNMSKKQSIDLEDLRSKLVDLMQDLVDVKDELIDIRDENDVTIAKAAFISGSAYQKLDKIWEELDTITDEIDTIIP